MGSSKKVAGQIIDLAGRPLATMCDELAALVVESVAVLLEGETGQRAKRDGSLLCTLSHLSLSTPGWGQYGELMVDLAKQVGDLRRENGSWPRDYVGSELGGMLGLAEGLAAFSAVVAETNAWGLARELVLRSLARCDSADYVGLSQGGQRVPKGARCLGEWAQILRVCTRLLQKRPDRELEIAAARAVAAVVNYHYKADRGLLTELVRHDFFHFDDHWGEYVHSGAVFEVLAALLYEAGRGGEDRLFGLACRYLRQHLEASWDSLAGGVRDEWVAGAWQASQTDQTQMKAFAALAIAVGFQGSDWKVEWLDRVINNRGYKAVSDPLASSIWLVQASAILDDLVRREGRRVDWLTDH